MLELLAALGLLVGAMVQAPGWAGAVRQRSEAEHETCWLEVGGAQARMETQLVRLGLIPQQELLFHWLSGRGGHRARASTVRYEQALAPLPLNDGALYVATVHFSPSSDWLGKLAAVLLEAATARTPGLAHPVLIDDNGDGTLLTLYEMGGRPGGWSGASIRSFYHDCDLRAERVREIVLELGMGLVALERAKWLELIDPLDIQVDDAGHPVLIPAALELPEIKRRGNRRPASSYRMLLAEMGLWLCDRVVDRAPRGPLNHLKGNHGAATFAEAFEELRVAFSERPVA